MSIITSYPAVPSRIFSLYAALANSEEGELRDQIEAWATPPSLASRGGDEDEGSSALFTSALQEARRLGIVEESEGRLRITAEARGGGKNGADSDGAFRASICRVLFDPARAEQAEHSAFMLALSWLLTKNPLQPLNFSEAPQEMLRADLGEQRARTELTNLSRFQNLLYWARYLGFATFVGLGNGRRVFPDPTRAIAGILPKLFGDSQLLEIESFLSALSEIYPVFEGGVARTEVEEMRINWSADADRLSISTSLALQRLADRGEIALEAIADARARILDFGVQTGRVSRVRRGRIL